MPKLSDFSSKSLSYDRFKIEYDDLLKKENGTFSKAQFDSDWEIYSSSEPQKKPTPSGGTSKVQQVGNAFGFTTGPGMVSTEAANELIGVDKIASAAITVGKALFGEGSLKEGLKDLFSTAFDNLFEEMMEVVNNEIKLRNKLNAQLVMGGDLSRTYRNNIMDSLDGVNAMAFSFDDVSDTAIAATRETGRFFTMNESVMENMAVTSRAFIGDMKSMAPVLRNFELVGVGAEKTLENINTAGKSSLTLGLNARVTTEKLNENIGKLNQYGFQNGVQGLNRMVQKSIEFRMNMQKVFSLAEDVMSPEKAIDIAANLQVLGGAIGTLGDPFKMMYMATNDVEGLQDAMIGAAESLAVYNEEQGRFEISGVNLRRAREMAGMLNMSMEELTQTSIAAAERTSAAADLMAAGVSVDEKQIEFLTNLARMGKDGKMVIEVPSSLQEQFGKTVELEDLNQTTAEAILANQEAFEKMDTKDIALEQFNETQKIALNISQIAAMLKIEFAKTYRSLGAEADEVLKEANKILRQEIEGTGKNAEVKEAINQGKSMLNEKFTNEQKSKGVAVPVQTTPVNNAPSTTTSPSTTAPLNTDSTPSEQFMMKFFNEVNKQKPTFIIQNNVDPTNERSYTRGS
jgi:hypothetical protein